MPVDLLAVETLTPVKVDHGALVAAGEHLVRGLELDARLDVSPSTSS